MTHRRVGHTRWRPGAAVKMPIRTALVMSCRPQWHIESICLKSNDQARHSLSSETDSEIVASCRKKSRVVDFDAV
jgi:hypothetical protein